MKTILTCLVMVTLFAPPLAAKEFTGTLQQVKTSGKIRLGYRPALPPMSFVDKDGVPVGYSIDLCQQIVSAVGRTIGGDVTVDYVPVNAEERFSALLENRIDLLCGGTTRTLSRGELVDFTLPTFATGASFMTLAETRIRNNFDGKKLGVTRGTTTADALTKLLREAQTKAEVVLLESQAEALKALDKGEIDAIAADQVVLIGLAMTSARPERYTVLPDLFSDEPFALAVRRNDADFRLVADRVIADLYRSRHILAIYDKWIGKFTRQRSSAFEALIQLNAIPE